MCLVDYPKKPPFWGSIGLLRGEGGGWGLHPLIHILLGFAQAQDVEKKKRSQGLRIFLV